MTDDGPYPVLLAAAFTAGDPYHLAVAGSYDSAAGIGGYAAVPGTGKALVGAVQGPRINGPAAVLKGLQHGLRSYEDGDHVRLVLADTTLTGLLARARSWPRAMRAGTARKGICRPSPGRRRSAWCVIIFAA